MTTVDPKALVLCIVFPLLAIAAVVARLRAKSLQKGKLESDDYVILPALLFTIGNAINVLYGAYNANLGLHMPTDPNELALMGPKLLVLEKMAYASEPILTVAITLCRWSILLFYSRLFTISRVFRSILYIVYAINFGWGIAFTLAYLFQCTPIDVAWSTGEEYAGTCIDPSVNYYYAVSTIIIDVMILTLPWPMIMQLKMELKQKIAVIGIFMLGAIVIAASIGKCYAFFTVQALINNDGDLTYDEAPLFYWTVPESCLAVVCACLPTLRPLFRGVSLDSLFGSIRSAFNISTLRSRGTKNSSLSHSYDSIGADTELNASLNKYSMEPESATDSFKTFNVAVSELSNAEKGNSKFSITKAIETRVVSGRRG